MAHDPQQHQRGRAVEVQGRGGGLQDLVGLVQVGVDVGGPALRRAGQQRAGMRQHDRVIVHIDDAALGGDALGDLVGVVCRRDAGADVQELADARLASQVANGTGEKRPGGARDVDDAGKGLTELVTGLTVGREVVLAAQPVVPDSAEWGPRR
jgi:hypothetical protein